MKCSDPNCQDGIIDEGPEGLRPCRNKAHYLVDPDKFEVRRWPNYSDRIEIYNLAGEHIEMSCDEAFSIAIRLIRATK